MVGPNRIDSLFEWLQQKVREITGIGWLRQSQETYCCRVVPLTHDLLLLSHLSATGLAFDITNSNRL